MTKCFGDVFSLITGIIRERLYQFCKQIFPQVCFKENRVSFRASGADKIWNVYDKITASHFFILIFLEIVEKVRLNAEWSLMSPHNQSSKFH